ncbi:hypothetical protein LYSHEL_26320 [Lysobacter helvus]|uniref:Uncharacterized protein n=2 Tax=Lysobacteraceae TaxID=32033 RepID=A0ABN6FV58_9GAMM|nr:MULTISPECIES: hypothetical protein [Lysobacter]BCT93607.1 hypothetical protein LYSCAS_26310 [Lysobacter caseinilyticus]BCT96761.1 hypothetical protein LYSHEL_26320 [Lysobacter helvus]
MSTSERDNWGSWCKFLLGSVMASTGAANLYRYFATGRVHHHPSRLVPLDLAGPDAALYYSLYCLAGAFLLAAGIRGLTAK